MTGVLTVDGAWPGVLVFTLNRPASLNALNGELVEAMLRALDDVALAPGVLKVIVLRGAGRAFCAGADLKWLASGVLASQAAHGRFHDNLSALCTRLESAPQVVIGAVHGYALAGGLELLLSCDLVVAAKDAVLGDEHIKRNLIPGGGSSQRLPRKVGLARGLNLLLTGTRMSGEQAHAWGLACQAVPPEELQDAALDLARELASRDALALATMKTIVRRGIELPLADGLWLEQYHQHRYRAASAAMDAGVAEFAAGSRSRAAGGGVTEASGSAAPAADGKSGG